MPTDSDEDLLASTVESNDGDDEDIEGNDDDGVIAGADMDFEAVAASTADADAHQYNNYAGAGVGLIRYASVRGMCLGVSHGSQLRILHCGDGSDSHLHWILPRDGRGEFRWARDPRKCIDVEGGHTKPGTKVVLRDCGGYNLNRHFQMHIHESSTPITWSPAHSHLCLDVWRGYKTSGTPIIIYKCSGRTGWGGNARKHQLFTVEWWQGAGGYQPRNGHGGYYPGGSGGYYPGSGGRYLADDHEGQIDDEDQENEPRIV